MKTLNEWFDEYSESHQNKTNKMIHWLCVPTILFSIIGILAHFSALLTALIVTLTLIFYSRLDLVLAVAMAALIFVMAWLILILPVGVGFYIALFIFAWIGQFYGHKIEGKKPSFFKDLQFLLIGPIWCMDAYLNKTGAQIKNPCQSANERHLAHMYNFHSGIRSL
ncbi:DUF962 domain-containing protein [Acinetobacter sp. ANC 4173]|uniref:Mpo1 family 2-hydroxy fatty acid dioxygenase n=1 Tax=Acinetobacter sp. ANC 4173 TaxID=2529837 RepID=UPI00103C433B|nr:Mpo1-like protein [Acinetobacter sp. ANC 4173]TCB80720.1 DUF962 domain-containing protein [Acinetobacter sp. ANC 4173]